MFVDISKAFDNVSHNLFIKLSFYNINASTLIWVNDFLSNGMGAPNGFSGCSVPALPS